MTPNVFFFLGKILPFRDTRQYPNPSLKQVISSPCRCPSLVISFPAQTEKNELMLKRKAASFAISFTYMNFLSVGQLVPVLKTILWISPSPCLMSSNPSGCSREVSHRRFFPAKILDLQQWTRLLDFHCGLLSTSLLLLLQRSILAISC